MSDMPTRLDANLIPVLHALLEHESVTRAGAALGMTQPATSHALARLRRFFDDPLLVRRGQLMEKTAKARGLEPAARRAVQELLALEDGGAAGFSPARARGELHLSAPVDFWWTTGAELARRLFEQAPELRLVQVGTASGPGGAARSAPADLVIDARPAPDAEPLLDDPWVRVTRSPPTDLAGNAPPVWIRDVAPGAAPPAAHVVEDLGAALALVLAGGTAVVSERVARAWDAAVGVAFAPLGSEGHRRRLWLHLASDAPALHRWFAEQARLSVAALSAR